VSGKRARSLATVSRFLPYISLLSRRHAFSGPRTGAPDLLHDSVYPHDTRDRDRAAGNHYFPLRAATGLRATPPHRARHVAAVVVRVGHGSDRVPYALSNLSFLKMSASRPILFLAVLFVAATFLAWYFSWFGRGLSDADISKYLADEKNPRHVQHALLQIQERMERDDPSVKNWYPQLVTLSGNPETEFRLTVAWLMGFDNKAPEFHEALLKLLHDPEPIVRRNAALALVRFDDSSGREELVAVLRPYVVKAPVDGTVASSMHEGATLARRTLLVRIEQPDGKVVELRSPLPGRVEKIVSNGTQVKRDEDLLTINSDEESVWEALRGLALVGTAEDLPLVQSYANSNEVSKRVKEQAGVTAQAISHK